MIIRICERCKQQFSVQPSVVKKGKARFCSRKCSDNPKVTRECEHCKRSFQAVPSLLKKRKARFCSRKCTQLAKADRKATTPPEERFWRLVDKNHPSGCWIWKGSKSKQGYGSFHNGVKVIRAHRFAEQLMNGFLPDGVPVIHDCDNPSCVRHVRRASYKENMEDCVIRGRIARGTKHGQSKLTEKDVRLIRKLLKSGVHQTTIANQFQVHNVTINDIHKKRTWSWLD